MALSYAKNTAAAPAAKSTPNKASGKATAATASDVTKSRAEAVTSLGQFAQLPLMITKQYADVGALSLHWPKISEEIAKLADTNEQVASLVDPLMKVGPYAGLIATVMPFAVQIAVNHGRVTAGAMGSVPATTLSSQVETSLAENELQALTIQRDAEKKAAQMRKEIADARKNLEEETANVAA